MVGSTQAHDARATTTAKGEENQIFRKKEVDEKKCWDKNRRKKKRRKKEKRGKEDGGEDFKRKTFVDKEKEIKTKIYRQEYKL